MRYLTQAEINGIMQTTALLFDNLDAENQPWNAIFYRDSRDKALHFIANCREFDPANGEYVLTAETRMEERQIRCITSTLVCAVNVQRYMKYFPGISFGFRVSRVPLLLNTDAMVNVTVASKTTVMEIARVINSFANGSTGDGYLYLIRDIHFHSKYQTKVECLIARIRELSGGYYELY